MCVSPICRFITVGTEAGHSREGMKPKVRPTGRIRNAVYYAILARALGSASALAKVEIRGDPCRGRRRLQPHGGRGRGSYAGPLSALRAELIDPTIAGQNGRVFKRTGDGVLVEFRSVVEAVRCAIEFRTRWSSATPALPTTGGSFPHRHPSGRCRRGERRRPDGGRRQHRGAAGRGRHSRARSACPRTPTGR